jgi:hypothetical protein
MKNSFDEFATFAPKFAQKITNALCLLDFYIIRQNVLLKAIRIDFAPNGAQMTPHIAANPADQPAVLAE